MSIEIKKIDDSLSVEYQNTVTILPANYEKKSDHNYSSTSTSFFKYAKTKLDIGYLTRPKYFLDQRSSEWFCPTLLITSSAILQNPNLVSILCGVISNYVTDFFKGMRSPELNVKILHKKTKTSEITEIVYKGNVEGLDKLRDSILEISNK